MKLAEAISCCLAWLALAGVGRADTNSEPWEITFDSRVWTLGWEARDDSQQVREYVLDGESVESWSELVTSQFMRANATDGVRLWAAYFIKSMKESNPDLKWTLIQATGEDLILEWRHGGNEQWPAQHEIKRLVKMGTTFYVLSYVKKTPQLSDSEREKWLKCIREATLAHPVTAEHPLIQSQREAFSNDANKILQK